ncbi:hypothetical protein CEXT_772101 [Caerostris extrusa]|uniref:Uncharacterized protein n=1 Tax=Caerostris extrusa TaxID=172846 RepID=A0AAV4XIJ5_CAEEX|nr:hypothetical protein CEXT_772101 [Caerostris extrusa]
MSRKIDDPPDAWNRKEKKKRAFKLRSENLSVKIFSGTQKRRGIDPAVIHSPQMRTLHSKSPSAAKDRAFMLHSRNYLDFPSIKETRSITKKGRFEKVEVGFRKAVIYVSNERRGNF